MRFLVVIATAAAVRLGRPTAPRTFLRRQGQCTRRQKAALRDLWPRYGVDVAWNEPPRARRHAREQLERASHRARQAALRDEIAAAVAEWKTAAKSRRGAETKATATQQPS